MKTKDAIKHYFCTLFDVINFFINQMRNSSQYVVCILVCSWDLYLRLMQLALRVVWLWERSYYLRGFFFLNSVMSHLFFNFNLNIFYYFFMFHTIKPTLSSSVGCWNSEKKNSKKKFCWQWQPCKICAYALFFNYLDTNIFL